MKILWFTLSPCGSLRRYNIERVIQGWMISLEDEIKKIPEIELEVAFFSEKKEEPFQYNGVKYYPMGEMRKNNPIARVTDRMRSMNKADSEKLPWMLDVVNKSNPDIIHIHGTEESFGLITDYIKHIPIVFSIQGLIGPYTEKFFAGITKHTVKSLTSLKDRAQQISVFKEYQNFVGYTQREFNYLSKSSYIFGRTTWDRNCTLALNPERTYFVVNEILRKNFYNKQWKGDFEACGTIRFISVISNMLYKGLETVIKASYILKTYSHLDFCWDIVGVSGDDKYVKMSEMEAGKFSSDCNVNYMGKINAEQLAELLCQHDIYIHPSHIENSPNSVCEAMLVGLPVIATNVGGTSSMVENGTEGTLIQDGDPYALAGAIVDLLNTPERAKEYAHNAKIKALKRHNKESIIQELITGYKEILEDYEQ